MSFDALDVRTVQSPILIVAPHPDDDILAAGGLIQRALALEKRVFVIFLTNGDASSQSVTEYLHLPLLSGSYIHLGVIRYLEAVAAEHFIGVDRMNLFFLSFPDGNMYEIATDKDISRVHRSSTTRLKSAVYTFSFQPNAPYTHETAVRLITSILKKVQPRTIVVNLDIDTHRDHKAARVLTFEAIHQANIRPQVYSSLIHYPNWPPGSSGPLLPPANVHIPGLVSLPLAGSEVRRTREAYSIHQSQASLVANNYNLVRSNELFWKA